MSYEDDMLADYGYPPDEEEVIHDWQVDKMRKKIAALTVERDRMRDALDKIIKAGAGMSDDAQEVAIAKSALRRKAAQ